MSRTSPSEIKKHLWRSIVILVFSAALAVFLARSGVFENILFASREFKVLSNFVAGLFFTSVLTIGPAAVALGELAQANSIWPVALIGAAGAVMGDMILFRFVRDRITDDFIAIFEHTRLGHIRDVFKFAIFHWLLPVLGFLVVASPLPDEIGLAMMGISKMKTSTFILISYSANLLGIMIVGLVAKAI